MFIDSLDNLFFITMNNFNLEYYLFRNYWIRPGDTFYALPGTSVNPTSEIVGIKVLDAEFVNDKGIVYKLQTPFGIYRFKPKDTPTIVRQLRWKKGRAYIPLPIKLLAKKGEKWFDKHNKEIVRVIESFYLSKDDPQTIVVVESIREDKVFIHEKYFSMGNFESLTKKEKLLHSKQRRQLHIKQINNRP